MSVTPPKLRLFKELGFEYDPRKVSGENVYGDCPFCGHRDKFYINTETGQWDCKAGSCQLAGNSVSFINYWYEIMNDEDETQTTKLALGILSGNRGIPINVLRKEGLVYFNDRWWIPVRNQNHSIVNLRYFIYGKGIRGLPEIEAHLFGLEYLVDENRSKDEPVYICEGEWDAIAMRVLLEKECQPGIVVGVPGANVWKSIWNVHLIGRKIIICYDNDSAGIKGTDRVYSQVRHICSDIKYIHWTPKIADGFDIRDCLKEGMSFDNLSLMFESYIPETELGKASKEPVVYTEISERPSFEEVVKTFEESLFMTIDMVNALRIIFAVVLSNQIAGDPIWMHIVSPAGTAKTELLLPLSGCDNCYFASTLSGHSLVSGYMTQGGGDPSLLPLLNGKTFVLKDFTEVLTMNKIQKDEIYSTLRGAYDGQVKRQFGNGLIREYNVRFNMLTGVTHAVFGERSASLGERFLVYHLVKGVGFKTEDAIRSAIQNVGKEVQVRSSLHKIVQRFIQVKIDPANLPEIPPKYIDRIIALSSLVAMLRANVEKVYSGGNEKLLYRPQHEMGTRLGKQLSKLLYGLSLVNNPPMITEREMDIVGRVALDTCVGLNLEVVDLLIKNPGLRVQELSEVLSIPVTTLREQLSDLAMLQVIVKEKVPTSERGAPAVLYSVSSTVTRYWIEAGLVKGKVAEEALQSAEKIARNGQVLPFIRSVETA